jgi:threonine/homoserine/homoserine lactone efflux protein
MSLNFLLQGWIIGFSIAMPVGPIAMLCIRHSLIRGPRYGLVAGLGAALADTFYGVLAGFGVTLVCDFVAGHQIACNLLGAFVLCCLGWSTLRAPTRAKTDENMVPVSFIRVLMTTFFLTLTNPLTLLGFLGVYAALGIGVIGEKLLSGTLLAIGIFMGSLTWWCLLSFSASSIGKRINFQSTHLLNKISGTAFLAFGILTAFVTLWQSQL